MAGYIEQERCGEFFCHASQTVQVNPDCPCNPQDDSSVNLSRWKWLIDGWDKMNFKERMALFTPYVKAYLIMKDIAKKYCTNRQYVIVFAA